MPVRTKNGVIGRALLGGVLLFTLAIKSEAQEFRAEKHPNHYIVLVDASGSTVSFKAKREVYYKALTERLPSLLYGSGFGETIPPIDPENDSLTLLQFGMVDSGPTPAYLRLKDYDLASGFIHRLIYRNLHVDQIQFKSKVVPQHYYEFTVLSWAKQVALSMFDARDSNAASNRTFLIMISDEIANGGVPAAEISIVETFGNRQSVDQVKDLVRAINTEYQFTNGLGKENWAFQEKIPYDRPLFFIEAYEVVPVAQAKWEADAKGLRPLNGLKIEWTRESNAVPEGLLLAQAEESFIKRLGSPKDLIATVSVRSEASSTEASWTVASPLRMPFSVQGELTCEPRSIGVSLQIPITQTDGRLGARTVNYLYQQSVSAPPAFRCTARSVLAKGLVAFIILLALLGLAYYLYYRLWATHLYVEIPGDFEPIRLRRKGSQAGWVQMTPQQGLEALSVHLPSRLKQRLLYRGAAVTLINGEDQGAARWLDEEGPTQFRLPLMRGSIPAYWRRAPVEPPSITLSFSQKHQRSDVTLRYTRALAGSFARSITMSESKIKAYVALDLGSESMAAYFEDIEGRSGMIKLQRNAEAFLSVEGRVSPDYLTEESAKASKISPRLWNHISINQTAQQPIEPQDDHAKLLFVCPAQGSPNSDTVSLEIYKKSLFNFFHAEGGWPPESGILPNPKILFQQQVADILNPIRVPASDGDRVKLSPEMLIQHLTVQVLMNFVLNSPELRRYTQEEIHMTVTVPNVYSLPHAESIKRFVRRCAPELARMEVLSESDAVGYYALRSINQRTDSPELIAFKRAWTKELDQTGKLCLVTIDVGKGTTDLSCILVQNPRKSESGLARLLGRGSRSGNTEKRRRHSVQAKTGKSSGGNYLNYIFARYYDARLKEVALSLLPPNSQSLPFGFITQATSVHRVPQVRTLSVLENLIERLKRSMNEHFEIEESLMSQAEQRELLGKVANGILTGIDPNWKNSADKDAYEAFKDNLVSTLLLPSKSEEPRKPNLFERGLRILRRIISWGNAHARAGGSAPSMESSAELALLKSELEGYVAENVGELITGLQGLVREHQAVSDDRAYIDGGAFVIISGQASQFKPLYAAIKRQCKDLGIADDQILSMRGVEAKEACCKGVINFWRDNMLVVNEKELHGTYGCIDYLSGQFMAFDMKKLNQDGRHSITLPVESTYLIVFTPRSKEEIEDQRPELYDGATALLSYFEEQSQFTINYDRSTLKLTVNDVEMDTGHFGRVDSSIYEKVWPEILQPSS